MMMNRLEILPLYLVRSRLLYVQLTWVFQELSTPEEAAPRVKRVIVEKELLLNLFTVCNHPGCGCAIDRDDVQMCTVGAAIIITATCDNSHTFKWSSSTKVGDGKKRMFLINILLASYVVLCGLNIAQVSQ